MTNRALVTGASGYLGWHVARALHERGVEVVGTSQDGSGLPPGVRGRVLALDDGGVSGAALVAELRPDVVLHLAAEANADACARDPERARAVNAEATGALARATSAAGAWLLYTSSDLVFDGTRPPYGEQDPVSPLGPYMESKVAGERATLEADPAFCVARVTLLYGLAGGRRESFTDRIVETLARGESIRLFTDQHRTPLHVEDAAEILCDLLAGRPGGALHVGGPERVSRHEHGLALARACGFDPALCLAGDMSDAAGLAPRPPDVSLRIDRLRGLLGRSPLGIAAGCERVALGRARVLEGLEDEQGGGEQEQVSR